MQRLTTRSAQPNLKPTPMIRTQISLILGTGVLGLALMSSSSGVAEIQNANRTGEPGASATCNQCHGGGSYGATTTISVLDPNSGQAVTEYLPGEQYVLEVAIGGTSPRFGMQATAVDAAGGNAGTFANPSSNAQLEDVAGRHIFEHNAASATNTFSVDWTAPATGGDVTIYASGLAAGGATSSGGDQYAGASLVIPEAQIVVEIGGCTYDFACNYNPQAAFDDGSCELTSCALQGDLDGDGAVTTSDLLAFLGVFGQTL